MIKSILLVAVIAERNFRRTQFETWKEVNKVFGEDYVLIRIPQDIRGKKFHKRVVIGCPSDFLITEVLNRML